MGVTVDFVPAARSRPLRFAEEVDVEREAEAPMILLRLLAREVERCGGSELEGGGMLTPGASRTSSDSRGRWARGFRTAAAKAAFFAASASSMRFNRSSFWALRRAAVASPGSWKFAFVGALVDFGGGGMLIDRDKGLSPPASSMRFSRSSF